jgi:phosphopantothenate---cysteine ligase (CTP)
MRKIIVTSGGTREYIDAVRVLTNVSSGKLGALIAGNLSCLPDTSVYYVHTLGCCMPEEMGLYNFHRISEFFVRNTKDTEQIIQSLLVNEQIDAVVHCMAVSDFTFRNDGNVKLKSGDPEAFIEYMRKTIEINPKIINKIKSWSPKTLLIGFKFEVDTPHSELINLAKQSIGKNNCDLVVANDKAEMIQRKAHVAHFVYSEKMTKEYKCVDTEVSGKDNIAKVISQFINKVL